MDKFLNVLSDEMKIEVTQEDIEQAKYNDVSLSTYLNEKYSDKVAKFNNNLDAFDIAVLSQGIIVRGDVKRGIESSKMIKFFNTTTSSRLLFPEFIVRTIRQSILEQPITQYLIGETQTITGDTMLQPVLDLSKESENRKALKYTRISEAADIPTTEINLAKTAITIYKYGRGVKASYEVLRRTTIDMFRKTVELIGRFISEAEFAEIIRVIEEGDGNDNPATVYKRSELNTSGTAGVLDDVTLLKFLMAQYPIAYDTLIVNQDLYLQLITSQYDTSLTTGVTDYVPFTFPQGIFQGLTILYNEDIKNTAGSKPRAFGLNRSLGIRKIIEQGSTIQENEKYASNQTNVIYMTENAGFGKIYNEASAILEVD